MLPRALALTALTLYILAAIAGASYYAVEIRRLPPTQANLLIGLLLAILLGLPAAIALWRQATRPQRERGRRQAETEARVAALARIPGAEPFLPLLRRGYPLTEDELRRRIARAQQILAVPHRAPFAQRLYDGSTLTDDQIDYLALPHRFALCAHFRPLEVALKQAGLVTYRAPGAIDGHFRPHPAHFPTPPGIEEQYVPRTSPRDDDDHFLYTCPTCRHTLLANGNGPPWPAP
jgi:hypothetical protein